MAKRLLLSLQMAQKWIVGAGKYGIMREARQAEGREATPSAAIADAQSVRTTLVKGERRYDASKKVNGRKQYISVDTMGFLLMVVVTVASMQDRLGAKQLPTKMQQKLSLPVWNFCGQMVDTVVNRWLIGSNQSLAGYGK